MLTRLLARNKPKPAGPEPAPEAETQAELPPEPESHAERPATPEPAPEAEAWGIEPYNEWHKFRIWLDYEVHPVPRWGYGKPPHGRLSKLIDGNRASYRATLQEFLSHRDQLLRIARTPDEAGPGEPAWVNDWLPGLDTAALYGFLSQQNPATYLEVGSGNSTLVARRAIKDQGLRTSIVSIDPHPRADVDGICDEMIRTRLEDTDLSVFGRLQPGDILFVDGSHRSFPNSDVTAMFLDVLPELPPGVLVEIHDVFLPEDYLPGWGPRLYSEQYLLATALLVPRPAFAPILPDWFISKDKELSRILAPLWAALPGVLAHGTSFWSKTS